MTGLEKCADCIYFSWRESYPERDKRPFGQDLDGYCSKVFPRGYLIGAGKPGGNMWHGKMHCFQFEPKQKEQITMEELQ